MSWTDLLPWLAQGGVTSVIAFFMYRLHSDAVAAERRRADDARGRAEAAERRADLREEQIAVLLGRGSTPSGRPVP